MNYLYYSFICVNSVYIIYFVVDVDRLPLVSSCIIQVSQDVDEPWPIEVYSHDGKAYNVTMEPRDMVLYESHTVVNTHNIRFSRCFY